MKPQVTQMLRLGGMPSPSGPVHIPAWQGFMFGSIAPVMAAVFTNPFDVAKVRIQLQGELLKKGAPKVYSGSWDCIVKTFQHEGIRGLEKGLSTAVLREGSKNLFRLGMYDPIIERIHSSEEGPAPFWKRMIAGAISGSAGAISCNPFEIIKTRMQSKASARIATGHQHGYSGVIDGFRALLRDEGVRGLYKGVSTSVLRSAIGTGINLAAYTAIREHVLRRDLMRDSPLLDVSCSVLSSLITAIAINPVDVVRTRLYNQPYGANGRGLVYRSGVDAAAKILRTEGFHGFFKGFVSSFLRLGPHFVLTFVFLEQMRRFAHNKTVERDKERYMRSVFDFFDLDKNGLIDSSELKLAYMESIPSSGSQQINFKQYETSVMESVNKIIARADSDNNGKIDFREFFRVSEDLAKVVRRHEQRAVFDTLDIDRDGSLSRTELLSALKSMAPLSIQDPSMTSDQYEAVLLKDIDCMVKVAHGQVEGSVTFEEFVKITDGMENLQVGRALTVWMKNAELPALFNDNSTVCSPQQEKHHTYAIALTNECTMQTNGFSLT
eukprot:CAMPEP_0184673118 /NCGR_PEP_ID=MMETSP0308-20130426/86504_1 /TAXON_ID=38269 /ORGANISM="Gloeochaete witrockiana, Strain SAG 46.84" /LENGTH=550 /DNA_ID=CAMNT_0027120573 /DNA_START=366 /DNA_END=2019 /DNA_ORIENTATION=+